MLLSRPHKAVAPKTSILPEFILNNELWNCRLVVTTTRPAKTINDDKQPTGFSLSLKNRIANMIEKMVSPFAKSEASDAVVCLTPKKNMAGQSLRR